MPQKVKSLKSFNVSSFTLHILAMTFMLLDHTWATVLSWEWMTCVGRIAFPIFAFMIVEGYNHTRNVKKYMLRMLIFALISEIPFNIMYGGEAFYPFHQNVMWTFLIALLGICAIEKINGKIMSKLFGKIKDQTMDKLLENKNEYFVYLSLFVFLIAAIATLFYLFGQFTFVDYYGVGVATVLVFYFFRGKKWWCYIGQFVGLYLLNQSLKGQVLFEFTLFGKDMYFHQQMLALLSLIPIWLYNGRQGYHSKPFQYFCYAFYPLHILILDLIAWLK